MHIETQVLREGKCNVRCPGLGCTYNLLLDDVKNAMTRSAENAQVLERLETVRSQSFQGRLKEVVCGVHEDDSDDWILHFCQPCPKCFVLARREFGCDHIICRCGCDFCFGCGAPLIDHGIGCLCGYFDADHVFAAWLRIAENSPCDWLWEDWEPSKHFVHTLGFWLWLGGADISPPRMWYDCSYYVINMARGDVFGDSDDWFDDWFHEWDDYDFEIGFEPRKPHGCRGQRQNKDRNEDNKRSTDRAKKGLKTSRADNSYCFRSGAF